VSPDLAPDLGQGLMSMPLILGEGTLVDALGRVVESARAKFPALGHSGIESGAEDTAQVAEQLRPLVSLLLYLCAENAEIGEGNRRPAVPVPKPTTPGPRLFPPDAPADWEVGLR